MKSVEGKVAFVTGGASGIGLAMTRSFASAGMKVVAADVEKAALAAVREEFHSSNAEVLALQLDVTDRDAMEKVASNVERAFGKVHVLCNNAGVAVGGSIDTMSYQDWDWVMNVNLQGVINGMVTFIERIKSHGEGGHIVNTASMAGQLGIGGMSVYNTTKFAVVGMSESMRHDLAPHNIGVSVLCPGFVSTNIFTSQRNRPESLQSAASSTESEISNPIESLLEGEDNDQIREMMSGFLDPSVVGDMVLHAIQEDEFYIFSHPQFQSSVDARKEEIAGSFERWDAYRRERGI